MNAPRQDHGHPLEHPFRHRAAGRQGVSLIELVVVMGIIVLLASLLLPGVRTVRDAARSVVCMNNLRQLGIANVAYAADHRGMAVPIFTAFPIASRPGWGQSYWWGEWQSNETFLQQLDEAAAGGSMNRRLLCPASTGAMVGKISISYGLNMEAVGYRDDEWWGKYKAPRDNGPVAPRLSRSEAQAPFAMDGLDWILRAHTLTGWIKAKEAGYSTQQISFRHRGLCNVVRWDGSVQAMGVSALDAVLP
jgi:prepilin-type N-terminal cleavage/methylation domain-containing protein/prepilin-type processing-associated H-X9-DG protein